jgi:hypothetical protein
VVALVETQVLVLSLKRIDRLTRRYPILAFRLFRNFTRIIGERLTLTSEYRIVADKQQPDASAANGAKR